jgi:hypothetical protein
MVYLSVSPFDSGQELVYKASMIVAYDLEDTGYEAIEYSAESCRGAGARAPGSGMLN